MPSQTKRDEPPLTSVEPHLKVYKDHSVLVDSRGRTVVFTEGPPSAATKSRWESVKAELSRGWLTEVIESAMDTEKNRADLTGPQARLFDSLADSVTSEVGRALVGVTLSQLVIKALQPDQSIRLHKGGRGEFSWVDGFPMRSLAADFVVPVLRDKGLLRGNIYGPMMTRSLAENYPYSPFYKAAIRGAKNEWVEITEGLEDGSLKAMDGLQYLISLLSNRSERFTKLADDTLKAVAAYLRTSPTLADVTSLIQGHIQDSSYHSRLLEVAMHSLAQVAATNSDIDGDLRPLCQMRTANKKHRNVGDIEITSPGSERIVEAWDAKFGHTYLRDELDELDDKLEVNESVKVAGFVTDASPMIDEDVKERIQEIETVHNTNIKVLIFGAWVKYFVGRMSLPEKTVATEWLRAYSESLCQKRREMAPIDEPADQWVEDLGRALT